MKSFFKVYLSCLIFSCIFTVFANSNIYEFKPVQEDFSKAFYKKNAALTELDGSNCLVLTNHGQWNIKLKPEDYANRTIYINYEFKVENITSANKNQGFKVMFVYTKNGKKTYCHRPPVSGTTDWQNIQQKIKVPEGISDVIMQVSIPNGKAWVKKLFISGNAVKKKLTANNVSSNVQNLTELKKKPLIDGIFTPEEWAECASDHVFISENTKQKALRNTFVYYGYDKDFFYLCQLGDVPPKPQKLSDDENFEIIFQDGTNKIHKFSICVNGKNNLPKGSIQSSSLSGKQYVAAGFPTSGKWVQEIAIPREALGLKNLPAVPCKITFRRNWKNPSETAVADIQQLTFDSVLPMVSAKSALFGVNARINCNVINHSASQKTLNLDIMIRSTEVPHNLNKQITVKPNSSQNVSQYFMVGGATDRNLDIIITDKASGKVIYHRNADWNTSSGLNFFNPDPPILMNFGLNPSKNRIIAKVESAVAAKLADVEKIEFKIIDKNDVIIQKVTANKKQPGFYFKDWNYPLLAPGQYTVEAEIFRKNNKKEILQKTFKIMNFEWQNTGVGTERKVPSPFKPLQTSGNEVHALLTGYSANGIFFDAVYAQNENILAAPVQLFFNGRTFKTESENWQEKSADRVVRVSKHSSDGLNLEVRQEYEFDGMCKTVLNFKPTRNQKVKNLYIDIPLKDNIAKLFHHTGFGIRSNPSEWIKQGKGTVRSLPWQMLRYPSYLWFGETYKGISFFSDMTPPLFDNKDGFASHEILRKNNQVIMRIHLAPPSENQLEPFEYVCGFQPTPVKPRPRGFRNYGGHFWLAKLPNMHMIYPVTWSKHFFSDISLGQPLVPYGNDHSFLEYIFSGRQDNESRDEIMARINALLEKHNLSDQKWKQLFSNSHDTSSLTTRMRQGAIFTRNKERGLYLNPRGGYRCWLESEMYDDEWMYSGWRNPDDNHYHRHPVKSYVDMLLFKTRNFLRQYPGCSGIYFDNLYPSRKSSLFHGARELSPGKNTFTGDIFSMRELVKRTLIMSEEEKRFLTSDPNYIWLIGHMTDANIVPVMGLLSANLGWEMKFGRQDYQNRFSEAFHLVQSLGTQTGTIPLVITSTSGTKAEREHQHRTLFAVGFAFDILNFWDPGSREEDGSPLYNSMQKLVREFGYGTENIKHFPGYEADRNPVRCTPEHVRITTLKRNDGQIMLLVGNLGNAAKVKLNFSGIKVSELKNAENNKNITNNEFELAKHDCAVLIGKWSN